MSRTGADEQGDDLALLIEAAGGDIAAWVALWPRVRAAALGQAYVWLGTGPEALDAVVDAMADLLDQADLGELDPEVPLQAEVAAATRDHAIEALQARLANGMGPPEDGEPASTDLDPDEEHLLLEALAGLPRHDREALWLVGALRLDPEDAAAVMGDDSEAEAVSESSDRSAGVLRRFWSSRMAGRPSGESDPVRLLSRLIPYGPSIEDLWQRIDRRRSGLDVAGEGDDRLSLALVAGTGIGAGVKVVDDRLWPGDRATSAAPGVGAAAPVATGSWQDDDDVAPPQADDAALLPIGVSDGGPPHVPVFGAAEPDARPHRRRAWLVPAAIAAAFVVLLGVLALFSILRDEEPVVSTQPVATTTSLATTTSTRSFLPSSTFTVPPATTAPPTVAPSSVRPIVVAPSTTRRATTTRPRATTPTTRRPYATFDDLSAAGVPVGLDEPTAYNALVGKFGAPIGENRVGTGTEGEGCAAPVKPHREVWWPGLRVAFIDNSLQYWQLTPGRTDLAAPGNIRIQSSSADVRAAGYPVDTGSGTFVRDSSPGDPQVVWGRLDRSDPSGKVIELSNWDHCGTNMFP